MIPIRDDQPRFSTPYITYFLIGLNLLIYFFESTLAPEDFKALIFQFGLVPSNVTALVTGASGAGPIAALLPFLSSMFLHGSWMHVILNMWFLWIFGDNIEDYLGHFNFLIFYLLSGVGAALAQFVVESQSRAPTVGASGAIAGVLGAYFLLYPRARVLTWMIIPFYMPAWFFLGYWFVLQFVSGAASSVAYSGPDSGGIAFWAHVGGFAVGIVLIKLFPERPQRYRYGTW